MDLWLLQLIGLAYKLSIYDAPPVAGTLLPRIGGIASMDKNHWLDITVGTGIHIPDRLLCSVTR